MRGLCRTVLRGLCVLAVLPVVLTRPQLEQLRSCVTDSLARDDAVRRRRGGDL